MAPRRVAVAASGGRDSTALLHATLRAARPLGVQVVALHVHHGLVAEADEWLRQVRAQSRRWGGEFEARWLVSRPPRGESVEAWARRERYRELAEMARQTGCGLVLLAHHRRDQAETFLLQALRGGGAAGLSAMPRSALRSDLVWARPWLDMPREAIDAYVHRHRLHYADDASNADARYARNRLRLQVWPALMRAFADAEPALCAAARRAREAAALAGEVAAEDLVQLGSDGGLQVAAWLHLPPARRRNALRAWLARTLAAGGPEALLDRLMDELPRCRAARWPAPGGEFRLHRGRLSHATQDLPREPPAATHRLDLSRPGVTRLPEWRGSFVVEAASAGGLDAHRLREVSACPRRGAERFRLAPRAAARSLKKQFQALGVPAWQRSGPLLYAADGRLLYVPGLGVEGSVRAPAGPPQLTLHWEADAVAQGPGQTAA